MSEVTPQDEIELNEVVAQQPTPSTESSTEDTNQDTEPFLKNTDETKIPEFISSFKLLGKRFLWLTGLLILQSFSSWILSKFQDVLQKHFIIALFLTMLIGAGGNAGSQSAVLVIRGLATNTVTKKNRLKSIFREFLNGIILAVGLGIVGYLRVFIYQLIEQSKDYTIMQGVAITASLVTIIMCSVLIGTLLPLFLDLIGIDPAHASPTIQVTMDILGVIIICVICTILLK